MKYAYDGANKSEIIKKYEVKNNKIIVTYLDKKTNVMDYDKELENEIKDKMLEQAIERDNKYDSKLNYEKRSKYFNYYFALFGITILGFINWLKTSEVSSKTINTIADLLLIYNFTLLRYVNSIVKKCDKLEIDYEKYNRYLSIRKDLIRFINEKGLFDGIKTNKDILNINSLDSYSTEDIKKLEENIDVIRKKVLERF